MTLRQDCPVSASNSHAILAEELARTREALREFMRALDGFEIRPFDTNFVGLLNAYAKAREILGTP